MMVEAIEPFSITIGDVAVFTVVFEHNSAEGFLISCKVLDRWFELWIQIPRSCREETPAALKAVLNRSGQSPYDLKSEPSRPSAFITLHTIDRRPIRSP